MGVRSILQIMRMPVDIDDAGVLQPLQRLLAVNEMVEDISGEYGHSILTVDKDMKIHLADPNDTQRIITYRTGVSVIKSPEGNNEKPNLAMQLMQENKKFRIALYCVFDRCFNLFLDQDQRRVYAAKYFTCVLRANNLQPRDISKKYNKSRRDFLLATATEQMIEGLMLDATDEYGQPNNQRRIIDDAKSRIKKVDPHKRYSGWYALDPLMIYNAYPELEELISPRIMQQFK